MVYWESPIVATTILLATLLGVGAFLARRLPVPASILGGLLGLAVGPSALGWLPLDAATLESGVYHALGVVFIALALQKQAHGLMHDGAKSMAFGISTILTLQTVVGLGVALLIGSYAGFGLLLPLAFEQGPGQALALGAAWERSGLPDGAQVGLILAAIGFAWSIVVGVPLVIIGRRLGWVSRSRDAVADAPLTPGSGDLTVVIALIGAIYAATWAVCAGVAWVLSAAPGIAAMVWGFHFLLGAILATGVRGALDRAGRGDLIDDALLGSVSGGVVDLATVAALAAVQLSVLTAWWFPILLISTIGGAVTLVACVWLGFRGFREAPFEHAVIWFGMSTATLPVGLALLREIDPDLRSPAPGSAVVGSGLSIAGAAPVVLFLHPLAMSGHAPLALALSTGWLVVILGGWWAFGGLRVRTAAFALPA